jgi:hypothetical protein
VRVVATNTKARCIPAIVGVRVNPKPIGSVRSARAAAIKIPTFAHVPDVVINMTARCMVGTVGTGANRKPIGSAKQEDSKQACFEFEHTV